MAATENITVLFTDLVGSTELASALTPDAGDEVRRKHFSALRQAIATWGGTEVKNLGDGLMVVFPLASAAVSCAVAMQQAVDRDNAQAEWTLGLRVALSAGEAIKEDGDYFGDPVIEAARLCASAQGGQILVAALVRAMAGRRSPHSFSLLGEIELKGLPGPVATLEVRWEPLAILESESNAVPPPSRLELRPSMGVIGRDSEAAFLADAFKRVATGEGREVVLVSGEAGIGKTTLATQLARTAFEANAVTLLGRGEEDLGVPYGPFVEALGHYVAHVPEEALRRHVESHGSVLGKIVPALRQRLGELPAPQSADPDTERYLLYSAAVGLLSQASERAPIVLVLDDLQWIDKPSLQLLRYLVTNTARQRLLIVGAYRDSELARPNPLTEFLAMLRRESGISRLALSGLDDTGVLAFMEAAAGHQLDDEGVGLAHSLSRETDGNPFFVGEVLRHLSEIGAIHQSEDGQWTAAADIESMTVPESVRLVIGSRVSRLGSGAIKVLPLASVIGREFDLDLLARVTGRTTDELLDILDAATAVAFVDEVPGAPGRYAFAHALVQHTLYQDMGLTRLSRAHRQVAEALEAIIGDPPGRRVGELAYHWSRAAQPANTAKAVAYARLAGEAALAALAPDDAVRYFSQALELFDSAREDDHLLACDLRHGLGEAQRQAGIAAFRETLLDAAHRAAELGDIDRLVRSALANSRGWFSASGVIDTEKVAVLEAALSGQAEDDGADRALTLATLCSELSFGPLERRRELADEAKAMARRLGDAATLIRVLYLLNNPLQIPQAMDELKSDAREALVLAEELGDPEALYYAASVSQVNAMQSGDFELADDCLDRLTRLSDRLQQPTLMWMTAFKQAGQAIMDGDPERAEKFATHAFELGNDSGQPDAFAIYGSQLMYIRHQQGRLSELHTEIGQAVAENPGLPAFRPIHALSFLELGDHSSALALLDVAADDGFASLPLDPIWMMGMTFYSMVAVELGAKEPARTLHDLLAPYHEQIPFIGTLGFFPVALSLGGLDSVLGRYDEAETHFVEATELVTGGDMRFFAALTELWWGHMLASRGGPSDFDRARTLLVRARDDAAAYGYLGLERRAVAELSNLA